MKFILEYVVFSRRAAKALMTTLASITITIITQYIKMVLYTAPEAGVIAPVAMSISLLQTQIKNRFSPTNKKPSRILTTTAIWIPFERIHIHLKYFPNDFTISIVQANFNSGRQNQKSSNPQ